MTLKNPCANCFRKFKELHLTFQVVSDNRVYVNQAWHDRAGLTLMPLNGRLPSAYSIPASRASPSHRWSKLTLAGFASPSFPTAR